jgi:hypothetical protein
MTETLADKQRQAHGRITRQGVAATAAILQELFGQRLVAAALQNTLQVIELLRSQEEDNTIRSWFRGMNPDLGDRPPALVIRSEPEHVVQAARAFLAQ